MTMEAALTIKRFVEVRKEQGYTQAEFAGVLESGSTTADIERGKTRLSGRIVVELLRQFRINPLWLYGLDPNKHLSGDGTAVLPKVVTVDASDRENMVLVNAKAAAGYPQNILDVEWYRQLPAFDLPIPEFRNASYRGFQVEGDSMMPDLHPGDWVLARAIDRIDQVSPGKMYVVVLEDSVMVKKIVRPDRSNNVRLVSINTLYPPYEIKPFRIQELWEVSSKLTFNLGSEGDQGLLRQLQASMEDLRNQVGELRADQKGTSGD